MAAATEFNFSLLKVLEYCHALRSAPEILELLEPLLLKVTVAKEKDKKHYVWRW